MSTFSILDIEDEKYKYLILSNSYVNPLNDIDEIEKVLGGYTGYVIFDLHLSHANEDYRFAEGFFDGKHFEQSKFKWMSDVNDNIKKVSMDYFYDHLDIIDSSLLSTIDKINIKNKGGKN